MEVRSEIQWFAQQMERKLRKHDPGVKSGKWRHWSECDVFSLVDGLRSELAEMQEALSLYQRDKTPVSEVIDECADVSNFAMMIADACLIRARGERAPKG